MTADRKPAAQYVPRPHQEPMHRHLRSGARRLLASGCGTGKTVVTATEMLDNFDVKRWLVVAPKAVAEDTWHREFAKWRHLEHVHPRLLGPEDFGMKRALMVDGKIVPASSIDPTDADQVARIERQAGMTFADRFATKRALRGASSLVDVVSYDWFPWLAKVLGTAWPYDGIVYDEETFLKNHKSNRWKAAHHVGWKLDVVTAVKELGGTPIPKGYEDLWAPMYLLDRGETMGATLTAWRDGWCEPDQRGGPRGAQVYSWKVREGRLDELHQRLRPWMLSVDVDIGVEVVHSDQFVALPAAARKAYEEIEVEYLAWIEGGAVAAANAAVVVGKLLQICNGSVYDETKVVRRVHDAKLDAIVEAVEASATPVLLAYPYRADEKLLAGRLGRSAGHIKTRGDLDKFRSGRLKVLIGHPASFSHGIDGLQDVCNQVFWFGATHNLEWYLQLYKRVHRPGQQAKTVYVRRFLAADTREEEILHQVLTGRAARQSALLHVLSGISDKESGNG